MKGEQLFVTSGIDEALRIVCDGFAEAGRPVLTVEPTFAMYRFYAELAGARMVSLHYDDQLRFPLDEVVRTLDRLRPRIFFLANPNNPTGALLGPRELRRILDAAVGEIARHGDYGTTVATVAGPAASGVTTMCSGAIP